MSSTFENMNDVLNIQKKKFIKDGPPSINLRVDRLNRLTSMLVENRYAFTEALSSDFGSRSQNASLMTDVYTVLPEITNAIKNIKKGQEFSYDYGFSFDEDFKNYPCRCGSNNCCGYIVREGSRWRIRKYKYSKKK